MAMLDVCAGVGTARLSLDRRLGERFRYRLVASGFAEMDDTLARAVQRYWDNNVGLRGGAGHRRLASDVWDLVRQPELLAPLMWPLPEGALLLIVGGSPCPDLCRYGTGGGFLGVTGPVSKHLLHSPSWSGCVKSSGPTSTSTLLWRMPQT